MTRFLLLIAIAILSACNSGTTQIQTPSTVSSGCTDGDSNSDFSLRSFPTYDDEIEDLLEEHCLSCHSAGQNEPSLDGWEDAESAARAVVSAIEKERMPPAEDLEEKVVRMFTLWEKADFPETTRDIDEDASAEDGRDDDDDDDRDDDRDSLGDDC